MEGVYDLESGYRCTDRLLQLQTLPTAIYCCNEEMAIGALLALNEHRLRVPQDISLICYDSGERAPFVRPALSSVHFPITEMAQYATRLLIDPATPHISFAPTIVSRDSIVTISK
ncbi:HTH-type transcriptional repressor PurR [compost metagenome]